MMEELNVAAEEHEVVPASLEDILSDKDVPAEETPAEETPAEETPAEETPAEETPAEETPAEETPAESEEVKGLKAALHAERTKRQALEKTSPEPEKKNFWEDPEGAIKTAGQTVEQKLQNTVLTISENAARSRYGEEDFNAKADVFTEAAQINPALIDRMLQSPDPAEFVYQTGAKETLLKEMGNPAEYKQKLTAEIKTELQKEFDIKLTDEIAKLANLPPSGAEALGEGNNYTEADDKEVKDVPLDKL